MTKAQILSEAQIMFIAGHETTASCMVWTLLLLSKNPQVKEKLSKIVNNQQESAPSCFLNPFGLFRQTINESMRLYPPVWMFSRVAKNEDVIGSLTIPKGSNIYFIHMEVIMTIRTGKTRSYLIPADFQLTPLKRESHIHFIHLVMDKLFA
jgi:cytochrome P450